MASVERGGQSSDRLSRLTNCKLRGTLLENRLQMGAVGVGKQWLAQLPRDLGKVSPGPLSLALLICETDIITHGCLTSPCC